MSRELAYVFEDLRQNETTFLTSNSGTQFEERIIDCFRRNGFDRRVKAHDPVLDEYLQKIKPHVLNKLSTSLLRNELGEQNPYYKNIIVHQPYGSQNYPDILVFTDYIVPVEPKFTKGTQPVPMWNGNFPKDSGIYIFGQYGNRRLTYFVGRDVLTQEEREKLYEVTENLRELSKSGRTKNGFHNYFRETYAQSNFDYFDENRENREQSVLNYINQLSRETLK